MTLRQGLILTAISLGLASQAHAFDMPPPVDAPEIDSIDAVTDGWYIRGDLGWNVSVDGDKPTYRTLDAPFGTYSNNVFDKARFSDDFTLSAGAGYQFNDFLRTDLTLDYFTTTLKGKTGFTPCGFASTGDAAFCSYNQQDMSALGLLANGYVDLGTYWGLTPYLGAGAGMSYVKWGRVNEDMAATDAGAFSSSDLQHDGVDSWRFTYALMAGMSYDISQSMKIDIGYRFSQIDDGDMFDFSDNEKRYGAFGAKGKDKGLVRHEVRAGLRMLTW